jgi:hypothetical protein
MVCALPVISTPLAVAAVAAHHAVVDERVVHELATGQRIVIGPSMPFPALPQITFAATPLARRLFSPIESPGEVAAAYTPSPAFPAGRIRGTSRRSGICGLRTRLGCMPRMNTFEPAFLHLEPLCCFAAPVDRKNR